MIGWIVLILVAGIPALFFILLFFVALLEKRKVNEFIQTDRETLAEPSRYFVAVNEAAQRLGFTFAGAFKQDRRSKAYRAYFCLWISPDRKTLAQITGGKTIGVPIKRTILISFMSDNRLMESTDLFGTRDLSGLTDRKLLLNAHLEELYDFHQRRLAAQALEPRQFQETRAFQLYESLLAMRVTRLQELGLARFIDKTHTVWSYSAKGALGLHRGLQQERGEGMLQLERSKLKRPGDV